MLVVVVAGVGGVAGKILAVASGAVSAVFDGVVSLEK